MICYDCGTQLKIRCEGKAIQVYDMETQIWIGVCPACDGTDFYREGEEYIFYTR